MKLKWVIFTDLDGTLLDASTYSFREAVPALKYLKQRKIPVIPCTSKTHPEVIRLMNRLGLGDPFIVENGSAVLIPAGYFPNTEDFFDLDGFKALILGKRHEEVLRFFNYLRREFKLKVKGFSEMTVGEIAELTQLSKEEAALAKRRFFSEPMVSEEDRDLLKNDQLMECIKEYGFRLLRGNRFYHLLGNSDKGNAVNHLTELFRKKYSSPVKTVGLGDSKNDFEMLRAVDLPVLVRKKDLSYAEGLTLSNLYLTQKPGPAGWAEAIEIMTVPEKSALRKV